MEDVDRKSGRLTNKVDTFTLSVENRFKRIQKELKKIGNQQYKLETSAPIGGGGGNGSGGGGSY
jgi:hypothetical protein